MAVQAKARAFQPVPVGTGGLVPASMVWSNYQDLDLHVFEPNSHVSILQRNGTNGKLDLELSSRLSTTILAARSKQATMW